MRNLTCSACGIGFTSSRPRVTYCGSCPCPVVGCSGVVESLGVCRSHVYRIRKYGEANPVRLCKACGKPITTQGWAVCSKECRAARLVESEAHKRAQEKRSEQRRQRRPGVFTRFVSVKCADCEKWFVYDMLNPRDVKYCSRDCKDRNVKARRRARKANAYVSHVNRAEVFRRDRYRCHLCGKRLAMTKAVPHPKAPVVDHLIPLASGGTHEMANVAAAHFWCNSMKGDRAANDQLLLIG